MGRIEGIRIKNFKTIRDATLGRTYGSDKNVKPLTPLTVVIGKNGVGKSTLFDVFGFLSDALKDGVEEACEVRGGFEKLHSAGQKGPIEIELYYKESTNSSPITYELSIDSNKYGRTIVKSERLRQRRKAEKFGRPYSFLILKEGKGFVWKGNSLWINDEIDDENLSIEELGKILLSLTSTEDPERENVHIDPTKLGIASLEALQQHPRISAFCKYIENWYLGYFNPNAVREALPIAKPQAHIDKTGANLSNVVKYMEREHNPAFQSVLNNIAEKIPDIKSITTTKTEDDRLLLCFNSKNFDKPFYASQMSDGTLKLFAYLLLLSDPSPHTFICIEEPENGLHHRLLEILAKEFREYADNPKKKSQVFITTHQPYFVNALNPDEVWVMEKGDDGFSTIKRASENNLACNMVEEGFSLGNLWYSKYLDA